MTTAPIRNRQVSLKQNPVSLAWVLDGNISSVAGAQMSQVFDAYCDAERMLDWDKARIEHGGDTCEAHLARSDAQRRADALYQIFLDAAANPDGSVGADFVTDIVFDQHTYETTLARLDGGPRRPLDPTRVRCETLDGVQLDPVEAVGVSLIHDLRRVVLNAEGVTIDLGRRRRFAGGARLAAQMQRRHCYWPGCWVPTRRCDIDHLRPHRSDGRTNPGNGEPVCGCHNRIKERGFTVTRCPDGGLSITRPDGTRLTSS